IRAALATGAPQAASPALCELGSHWLDALVPRAPHPVAAYLNIEAGKFITVRREIRRRMAVGAAPAIVPQLAALADALDAIVARLPAGAFDEPRGEGDWTVAEAIGHDAHARGGLSLAGALGAAGPLAPWGAR